MSQIKFLNLQVFQSNAMNVNELRCEFPILQRKIYGKNLVYFDNAATIQRPTAVVNKWNEITLQTNANIHRAVHKLANDATMEYEDARLFVRDNIHADSIEEVIFTSGTTASINTVAYSFGEKFIAENDEILVTESDHHSNIVPWQLICQRKGAILKRIPVLETGEIDVAAIRTMLNERTRIVAVPHISNVLGIINPVKEIITVCHCKGIPVLVDGAQGIVHVEVNVKDLDCDFYAFSGHKVYGAPGTGILYGKKKWLEQMPPYMGGGEMVGTVSFNGTTFAPLPLKFEAGTQNIAGNITLKTALRLANMLKHDEEICNNEKCVREYLYSALLEIPGLRLFGKPSDLSKKIPLFSFEIDRIHHEDMAILLDKMGIAVRSGQMCAEPLMTRFGVTGMVRASLAPYNTMEEAEYFVKSLKRAISMLWSK